ncbi:MAG: hypothetical protein ACXW0Z_18015 [Gemmatirosa sp.]
MTSVNSPRARVMLVEDQSGVAEALEVNLRRDGDDVVCVRDGRDALLLSGWGTYDLIILDLGCPRPTG